MPDAVSRRLDRRAASGYDDDQAVTAAGFLVSHGRAVYARGQTFRGRPTRCGCSICRKRVPCPTWASARRASRPGPRCAWAGMPAAWESRSWPTGFPTSSSPAIGPRAFALAQFWVDTRDTRNVSRATRFCHRFVARLEVDQVAPAVDRRCVATPDRARPGRCADLPARAHRGPRRAWQIRMDARALPAGPGLERV